VAPVTTRAIVLRGHDYGDSSRIIRFYTEAFGLLSVVAHGATATPLAARFGAAAAPERPGPERPGQGPDLPVRGLPRPVRRDEEEGTGL